MYLLFCPPQMDGDQSQGPAASPWTEELEEKQRQLDEGEVVDPEKVKAAKEQRELRELAREEKQRQMSLESMGATGAKDADLDGDWQKQARAWRGCDVACEALRICIFEIL